MPCRPSQLDARERSPFRPPRIQDEPKYSRRANKEKLTTTLATRAGHVTKSVSPSQLDQDPEHYLLAPINMYEYEGWANESDDDGEEEEVEWNAGITDFALFDDAQRRAQETNQALPTQWQMLLISQTLALDRSFDRGRSDASNPEESKESLDPNHVPSLTPDDSPDLRDDLDSESARGSGEAESSIPSYLTVLRQPRKVTQTRKEPTSEDDDFYLPVAVGRSRARSQSPRRCQRPGLLHSRTMSGHAHSWSRPSSRIYTVGEEPDAEAREDVCAMED